MRRALAVLALLLPIAALASFGPRYGGTLRVGLQGLPGTLGPQASPDAAGRLAQGLVHETLVRIGPDSALLPGLAASWSAAGADWTLALPAGLTFHDGQSLTSLDCERSLRRFARSDSAAAAAFAAELLGGAPFRARTSDDLPGVAAPDPLHLVLRLGAPGEAPLAPLASPGAAITSEAGAGAGPFQPTVRIPGRSLAVTAFAGHVRGRPFVDAVLLSRPEHSLAAGLGAGELDLAQGEEGPSTLAATLLLILDPAQAPFDRAETRRGVAAALEESDFSPLLPGSGRPRSLLVRPGEPRPPLRLAGRWPLAVSQEVPQLLSQRLVALLQSFGLEASVTPLSPEGARESRSARLLVFLPEVAAPSLVRAEVRSLAGLPPLPPGPEPALRDEEALAIPLLLMPVRFGGRKGVHGAVVDPAGRLVLEDAWVEP
jgi:hypothetical protein